MRAKYVYMEKVLNSWTLIQSNQYQYIYHTNILLNPFFGEWLQTEKDPYQVNELYSADLQKRI